MNYQEFCDFTIIHLWKVGDQVVIDNIDTLVTLAESELNRIFKVEDRAMVVQLPMIDNVVPMPPDVRTIRNVHVSNFGDFSYATPSDFYQQLDAAAQIPLPLNVYTTVGKQILLSIMADPNVPLTLTLTYYANIPKFKDMGASWLADEYLDVYLYCVLKHTAPFLREDERIPVWQTMYSDALGSAMAENDENKYAGSPLAMRFQPHA